MKNTLIRVIIIFLLGVGLYFNYYDQDEYGLGQFMAHVLVIVFTIVFSIPIIFIKNKDRLLMKFIFFAISVGLAFMMPLLGVGQLKLKIEDMLYDKQVDKNLDAYNVTLPSNAIAIPFGKLLLADMGDGKLYVYDERGNVVNQVATQQLAKDISMNLPLTEEQKKTTYYDGYESQRVEYDAFEKVHDNQFKFTYRYVTAEVPENFKPDPDMPSDATDILFHYLIDYVPAIDSNGDFVFDVSNYQQAPDYLSSYKAPRIESIVAPARAKLIQNL